MESSHVFGDHAEECQSSESGWTMYIGSPIHSSDDDDDDNHDHDEDNNDDDGHDSVKPEDDDSDDSMASDACSGPSHHKLQVDKDFSNKKAKNPVEKKGNGNGRRKKEKEQSEFSTTAKGAKATSESSGKVKKSSWFGKRK